MVDPLKKLNMESSQLSSHFNNLAGNISIVRHLLKDAAPSTVIPFNFSRIIANCQQFITVFSNNHAFHVDSLEELISDTLTLVNWVEINLEIIPDIDENRKNRINDALRIIKLDINSINSEILDELPGAKAPRRGRNIGNEEIKKLKSQLLFASEKIARLDEAIQKSDIKLSVQQQEMEEGMQDFYAKQKEAIATKLDEMISFIEIKKGIIEKSDDELKEVISILASKALGGGFMENAVKEERFANRYRIFAIILMGCVAIFFVMNLIHLEISIIDFNIWLGRLVIGIFFSFFIGYLVKQSSVHRAQQFAYQQKAFDLNALSPYVANLPEDVQHKIKQQMAEKLFVSSGASPSQELSFPGVQELLIKLVDKMELPKTPR